MKMKGIEYEEKNIADGHKIQDLLALVPNAKTMPQIWLDGEHIGGYDRVRSKTQGVENDTKEATNKETKI
jgi:glutaredoxin